MNLSKEASYLISECYDKKNEPMAFVIEVGEKFTIDSDESKKYKITNEIIEELQTSGLIRVGDCGSQKDKDKYMLSGKKGGRPE